MHDRLESREPFMASIVKPPARRPNKGSIPTTTRPLETEWLLKNAEKYDGQWVAIEDDHLYSHGADAVEVFERAKKLGAKSPLIIHVQKDPELPWAGW